MFFVPCPGNRGRVSPYRASVAGRQSGALSDTGSRRASSSVSQVSLCIYEVRTFLRFRQTVGKAGMRRHRTGVTRLSQLQYCTIFFMEAWKTLNR